MLGLRRSAVVAGMAAVMVGLSAGAAVAGPARIPVPRPVIGQTAAVHHASTTALAPFVGPWAGYIAANPGAPTVFRGVSTVFRVPPLNCVATRNATAIQGVSLDGYLDATMEAAGVLGICTNGLAADRAGWQMPNAGVFHAAFAVNPGDLIAATVVYNRQTATYTLAVNDGTIGRHFAVMQQCAACASSSAEVITQAAPPHGPGGGILADFGQVVFANIRMSDYGACAAIGPLVRPACWQTVPAQMVAAPPTHHATAGPIIGVNKFTNAWVAVP